MSAFTEASNRSAATATSIETASQGLPQTAEDIPKISESAKSFFTNIADEDYFKSLLFEDKLVTVSDTGKEVGEFTISIQAAQKSGAKCFLVHANSHGAIDGVPCGTSITTYVDFSLSTLEQHHHEYVKLDNHPLDRKTIITKEGNLYVVNRVIRQAGDVQRSVRTYKNEEMEGFVSEGSNLLLQRILVKFGLPENFEIIAFDAEANLCHVSYKRLDDRIQIVDGVELQVIGLERTITALHDLPTTWQTYYMKDGHMTSRVQVGSPVTMKLLLVPETIEEDEEIEKPKFDKKELNWREDMQLYSKFLDRKEELKADHAVYMKDHPEVKALLADFLQFLLLRKPDDVIEFASEFFASHSPSMPAQNAYLSSSAPNPFPNSRSNTKIEYLSRAK